MFESILSFVQGEAFLFNGEMLLRLLIAVLCGAVIGYERTNRGKGAGIRTHTIVAIASCLMMIISQYGFDDFLKTYSVAGVELRLDPSRVAAQIVSGIGFLGAGMIFIQKNVVMGLTTAAGIWAVAGIGMAIGSGMYFLGIACVVIVVLVQFVMHRSSRFSHIPTEMEFTFLIEDDEEDMAFMVERLNEFGLNIISISCSKNSDRAMEVTVVVQDSHNINKGDLIKSFYKDKKIKMVKM